MKRIHMKDFEGSWRIFAVIAVLVLIPIIYNDVTLADADLTKHQGILPHTRAPEPSTLVLFGSGMMGMMASFVRRTYATAKRCMDIAGSMLAIIVLSPICFIVALLIKLTSQGPVFFKQTRLGLNGRPFEIYKFRTMKVDAENRTGPVWATKNDHRLIPVGNFLRRTHLDEIPQFMNVLKGEMSIIGPRPERPFFVAKLKNEITGYEKRLLVKPGITGLAQVCHRYDETTKDVKIKVKYDLLYIKKMCLFADIRIMYRTLRLVLACV